MKSKNVMGKLEYVLSYIFWLIPVTIWYKSLLFRCYGELTVKQSWMLFFSVIAVLGALGLILTMKKRRNNLSLAMCIVLPIGVYTAMNFISIRKGLIIASLAIAAVASAVYLFLVFFREIENKREYKRIALSRIKHALSAVYTIFTVCLLASMAVLGVNFVFGNSILYPSVAAEYRYEAEWDFLSDNMEDLLPLADGTWEDLSLKKKLDILQIVANNEKQKLGLPNELIVGAGNIADECMLGYYSDGIREIVINVDVLESEGAWEALETVCHEAYHSYEYRMVDLYCNADDDLKGLSVFEAAAVYADELRDYSDSTVDYDAYYSQLCESDAREYASETVGEYYLLLTEYMADKAS